MGKAKNRWTCGNRLVHYARRDTLAGYRFLACNGIIVTNTTHKALALTCFVCITKSGLQYMRALFTSKRLKP